MTAFLTQSLLPALRSLLCIRNARYFVVSELLPKWPWAEPSKAPPLDDYPQVPPGRPVGRWLPATFRLGSGCWNQYLGPQRAPSVPVENGLVQSWRTRGSNLSLPNPIPAPVLAEGCLLRNMVNLPELSVASDRKPKKAVVFNRVLLSSCMK